MEKSRLWQCPTALVSDPSIEARWAKERENEEADWAFDKARLLSFLRSALRLSIRIGSTNPAGSSKSIVGFINENGRFDNHLPRLRRSQAEAWRRAYLRDGDSLEGPRLREGVRGFYLEGEGAAIPLYVLESRGRLSDLAIVSHVGAMQPIANFGIQFDGLRQPALSSRHDGLRRSRSPVPML